MPFQAKAYSQVFDYSDFASATDYEFTGGELNDLSNWENSAGDHPESFAENDQVFIISDHEPETDGDWTVSGSGSELLIDTDHDITFSPDTEIAFDGITISFTEDAGADLIAYSDIVITDLEWSYEDKSEVWSVKSNGHGDQTITADDTSYLLSYNFEASRESGVFALETSGEEDQNDDTVIRSINNFTT